MSNRIKKIDDVILGSFPLETNEFSPIAYLVIKVCGCDGDGVRVWVWGGCENEIFVIPE
jgi:hypothetical protein